MSRKLVFSAVSALALMTIIVSAQEPAQPRPGARQSADRALGELTKPANDGGTVILTKQLPDIAQAGNNPNWTLYWNPKMGMNREEMQLAHESEELVKQLGKAEGEKKDKIKTKLTETLGKQFDARQKRHDAELAALEAQIKKLKEMVQKRQENRRDIIARRLDQLARDAEGLGW
jgi:hypothetical protein